MLQEYIKAFFLIFIAEMGDKTQIMAMAFATRFKVKSVLSGIFLGVFLNHGIAVVLGAYLSKIIPINAIQIVAGFSFIGFSLWTLRAEEDDENDKTGESFGPVLTVAIAFFIGELGDKTQLTAITLAADARYPLFILFGTVSGMVVTGALGIFVGSRLGSKIPEFTIKLASAAIFMFFGITKLLSVLPGKFLTPVNMTVFFTVLAVLVWYLLKPLLERRKKGIISAFKETSQELYEFYNLFNERVEDICLGEAYCGKCIGKRCIIGYTKSILNNIRQNNKDISLDNPDDFNNAVIKDYDKEKVIEGLGEIIVFLTNTTDKNKESLGLNRIRQVFEKLLFNESVDKFHGFEGYCRKIDSLDHATAAKVLRKVEVLQQAYEDLKIS